METIRECPHCGEPTMPNRLEGGAVVCSCAAERDLPPGPRPVDAASHQVSPQSGTIAVASISTRASDSASATTPTSAMAGKLRPITDR